MKRCRVVVAPDKFKGSLSASQAAAAIAQGLRTAKPDIEVIEHPIADGGEGTVDMLLANGFRPIAVEVTGPLGGPVSATFAIQESTAVIEAAAAVGLSLLSAGPDNHTALRASTYGVGQLIAAALDRGAKRIVVAVGGTASTDGGAGAVAALGARLVDPGGDVVSLGGAGLTRASRLNIGQLDPRLNEVELLVACDVDNPLTGPLGAAAVYGPQKGANARALSVLEAGLNRWADLVTDQTGPDIRSLAGTGAAGGLSYGLAAILGARLTPGADLLLKVTGFDNALQDAHLVIVGEGCLDRQSLHGKGPLGVARAAAKYGVRTMAVVGKSRISAIEARNAGLEVVYTLADLEGNEACSMSRAANLLQETAERLATEQLSGPFGGRGLDKVVASAAEAVADIARGSTVAVGGFGLCGIPSVLIDALLEQGADELEAVSNNCGVDALGLGRLLFAKRIRRMISSYVGENKEFARQYLQGELEVELTPQGTLAERMRAGGTGIPAFFTATGVGTQVAEGGLPWRYDDSGNVVVASPPKEVRIFTTAEGDKKFVLEEAVVADFGLVRAWKGDRHGNLVYRQSARNFNPLAAMCGRVTIAEVEHLVEPGEIGPDDVHTPGVFVQRVVPLTPEQAADKRIEKRTVSS